MFSSENKFSKIFRTIIDVLNVLLGIAVIVMAVMTFMNANDNAWMFPIIFFMGGLMNCFTGVKHLMNERKIQGIVLEVVALALFGIAYASYVAVGGI